MSTADLSRGLLRWLSANDLPELVILACPNSLPHRVPKRSLVVQLPSCSGQEDSQYLSGLCAQILAVGIQRIAVIDDCEQADSVLLTNLEKLFTHVVTSLPEVGRWKSMRPEPLELGMIPLPRRMVLGIGMATSTKFPLDLRADEGRREMDAMTMLHERGEVGETELGSRSKNLLIEGCVACGICVKACPHDALALTEPTDSTDQTNQTNLVELVFDPGRCQGDAACAKLCPENAISFEGTPSWQQTVLAQPQVLAQVETRRCTRCQVRHHEVTEKLCSTCRKRVSTGFGTTADLDELIRKAQKYREQL